MSTRRVYEDAACACNFDDVKTELRDSVGRRKGRAAELLRMHDFCKARMTERSVSGESAHRARPAPQKEEGGGRHDANQSE